MLVHWCYLLPLSCPFYDWTWSWPWDELDSWGFITSGSSGGVDSGAMVNSSKSPPSPTTYSNILRVILVPVQFRTEVQSTPSSTRLGFELMTSESWQCISCHETPAQTTRPSVTLSPFLVEMDIGRSQLSGGRAHLITMSTSSLLHLCVHYPSPAHIQFCWLLFFFFKVQSNLR